MKLIKLVIGGLLLLGYLPSKAQAHLARTWSVAPATPLNGKGFNLMAHYHLNSFDEFRGGFALNEFNPSDTLKLIANYLSVDYAKGFKPKIEGLHRMSIYLGTGFFYGKETSTRLIEGQQTTRSITGLKLFSEIEFALFEQLSYWIRLGRLIPFGNKESTNLIFTTGVRFYF